MARIISFAQLIKDIGYDATLEVMIKDLGYEEQDAKYILEFELGNIDSDIVKPDVNQN